MIFRSFRRFFEVLGVFGPVQMRSDLVGCIRMHTNAFGSAWTCSTKLEFGGFANHFFGVVPIFEGVQVCFELVSSVANSVSPFRICFVRFELVLSISNSLRPFRTHLVLRNVLRERIIMLMAFP